MASSSRNAAAGSSAHGGSSSRGQLPAGQRAQATAAMRPAAASAAATAAAAQQQPYARSFFGGPELSIAAPQTSIPAPAPGLELPPLGAVATSTPTPYRGARTPFPLPLGADHLGAQESLGHRTHLDEERRCFYLLLSPDLHIVHADPALPARVAAGLPSLPFAQLVHPRERRRVGEEMRTIVGAKNTFGSVTRCRFRSQSALRSLVAQHGASSASARDSPEEDSSVAWLPVDIVVNYIGEELALAFCHAVVDRSVEDNDEEHKTSWSNWCGSSDSVWDDEQCERAWTNVLQAQPTHSQAPQAGTSILNGASYVFQILSAGPRPRILLSWPPPRLYPSSEYPAATTAYTDGSYFASDFAALAQGVSASSRGASDANTSCTRRFRARHTLTSEARLRTIESVLIPYGDVVLACFSTTFDQPLAGALPPGPESVPLQPPPPKLPTPPPSIKAAAAPPATTASDSKDAPPPAKKRKARRSKADADAPPQPRAPRANTGGPNAVQHREPLPRAMPKWMPPEAIAALSGPIAAADVASASSSSSRDALASLAAAATQGTTGDGEPEAQPEGADRAEAKACSSCGTGNSPEWRKGPTGEKTLCNACGLRYARSVTRKRKKEESTKRAAETPVGGGTAEQGAPASSTGASAPASFNKKKQKSKGRAQVSPLPPPPAPSADLQAPAPSEISASSAGAASTSLATASGGMQVAMPPPSFTSLSSQQAPGSLPLVFTPSGAVAAAEATTAASYDFANSSALALAQAAAVAAAAAGLEPSSEAAASERLFALAAQHDAAPRHAALGAYGDRPPHAAMQQASSSAADVGSSTVAPAAT